MPCLYLRSVAVSIKNACAVVPRRSTPNTKTLTETHGRRKINIYIDNIPLLLNPNDCEDFICKIINAAHYRIIQSMRFMIISPAI